MTRAGDKILAGLHDALAMTQAKQKADELRALAERCEQAEGANDALDLAIAEFGYHSREPWGPNYDPRLWVERNCWQPSLSLNDAIKLVPEGWWWTVGDCSVSCDGTVGPDRAHCDKAMLDRFDGGILGDLPHPSTPALALCAVSLRARAAILETEQ